MEYTPKKIKLEDWELFGGGHNTESYYNKTDDSVMLKLYSPIVKEEEILWEKKCPDAVIECGVETTPVLDLVIADDGRLGITFERLKNKKSVSRLLADNPDKLDEYAKLFAEKTRELHSLKCNKNVFPSKKKLVLDIIDDSDFLEPERREKIRKFFEAVPDEDTCIHGDLHTGNLLVAGEKVLWIDLPDFAWGNPLFDLGLTYLMFNLDPYAENDLHCNSETLKKFWRAFVKYYKGCENDKQIDEFTDTVAPFCVPRLLVFAKREKYPDWMRNIVEKYF